MLHLGNNMYIVHETVMTETFVKFLDRTNIRLRKLSSNVEMPTLIKAVSSFSQTQSLALYRYCAYN